MVCAAVWRKGISLVAGLPRNYWYLWITFLIWRAGAIIEPFLVLYFTNGLGLSVPRATLVVALYGSGDFAATLIGSVLVDRIGRRQTLMLSLALRAMLLPVFGIAHPFWLLVMVAPVAGIFAGGLAWTALAVAVADIVPAREHVRAYGLLYWAQGVGAAICPIVAGVIVAQRGYFPLFAISALVAAICGTWVWLRVPETRPMVPPQKPGESRTAQRAGGGAMRDPLLLAFAAFTFGGACIMAQRTATLPLTMHAHGLNAAQYGRVIALNGIVAVLLAVPVSRLLSGRSRLRSLAVSALLVGAGFGMTGLVDHVPLYAITVILWTVGEVCAVPVSRTVVMALAPTRLRGAYEGIYGAAFGLAAFAGPAAGGVVFARFGPGPLWAGCAILGGLIALGYGLLADPIRRRSDPERRVPSAGREPPVHGGRRDTHPPPSARGHRAHNPKDDEY